MTGPAPNCGIQQSAAPEPERIRGREWLKGRGWLNGDPAWGQQRSSSGSTLCVQGSSPFKGRSQKYHSGDADQIDGGVNNRGARRLGYCYQTETTEYNAKGIDG